MMRPLEITISLLLLLYLIWFRHRPFLVRLFPVAALTLTLIHWIAEGYRWQMIPLYTLTVILTVRASIGLRPASAGNPFVSILTLLLLAVSTALPVLLPVPSLPSPSGPYRVGTRSYELTDPTRQEIYSGKEEERRFQIQVWYPAQVSLADERALWMSRVDIFAPAIATYIHMPSFFLDHLALVKVPAYQESMVSTSGEPFPIILFSHGWNGFNAQNTSQAIELASHGYVVAGVQHTYGAVITAFDDGTIAPNNPSALPGGAANDEYEVAAQKLVDQWAGDLAFALDFMETQAQDQVSPFYQSLDLSRVGAYGHSTGGGAVIQFCGTDARCQALLGMDPFMRPVSPEVLQNGVKQPAFFMFSQSWADDRHSRSNELFRTFIPHVPRSMGVISIQGTTHYDFSDLPLLSPLAPRLGLKGPINGRRVTVILNDYLISFFDATLRGQPVDLFEDENQKYNEVKFSK
jgi:hypothetical protein